MPARQRPRRCKLLTMALDRSLRARVVLALAVCAVLWSDPAFAEMVCAATPACPHHAVQLQQSSPVKVLPIIAGAKSCCPAHSAPLAPADTPTCCAVDDTGAVLPAASFVSGNTGSKHALAALASALFAPASLTDYSSLFDDQTAVSYVQPVNQKKTDLRI